MLRHWISRERLHNDGLCQNPHPTAMEWIKEHIRLRLYLNHYCWSNLSENYSAIDILREHKNKINWFSFSYNQNPDAISLIEEYQSNANAQIYWSRINENYYAVDFLQRYPQHIRWEQLAENRNPIAMEMIKKNIHELNKKGWLNLCCNPTLEAMEIIENYSEHWDWSYLSANPCAIPFLKNNQDKIDWHYLSFNPAPEAIEMLRNNPNKIDWKCLSDNPAPEAIEMLRNNPKNIDWFYLRNNSNPSAISLFDELLCPEEKYQLSEYILKSLSSNPDAISFFENSPQLIYWSEFSSNYAIFEEETEYCCK